MTSSHISLRNANPDSSCFSKYHSIFDPKPKTLNHIPQTLKPKPYFSFRNPVAVLVLMLNDTQTILSYLTTNPLTKLLLDSQSFDGEAEVLMSF